MQVRAIKSKIKSTQNISKITRTMEMVSAAKMRKALGVAEGIKPFYKEAKKIMSILGAQNEKHILMTPNSSHRKLVVLIAGQKGLCGAFNTNIYRKVYKYINENNSQVDFITINRYAEKIAKKFKDSQIIYSFTSKNFSSKEARVITKTIISAFEEATYNSVDIIYTNFNNINLQFVEEVKLFPFLPENFDIKNDMNSLEYSFEPGIDEVYEKVINVLVQNLILAVVNISLAAEHASRMLAMKNATDNAKELLSDLKLWFNKARQASITQEIAEISAGSIIIIK